jgi:predicted phosphate transport protein (TIGR00153 family)
LQLQVKSVCDILLPVAVRLRDHGAAVQNPDQRSSGIRNNAMALFPKKIDFFEQFDRALENVSRATNVLVDTLNNFETFEKKAKVIYEFEQEGDMLTHDIMKDLNKTFLTPIDREDIHALASRIDDVIDLMWAAVDRMTVYRIEKPTPEVISIAEDLQMTADILKKALRELRAKQYSRVQEHCIEINRLENRIDRKYRDALGKLVNDQSDPVYIIKWKDIYQLFEDASDRAEDIANILESIVLKNA